MTAPHDRDQATREPAAARHSHARMWMWAAAAVVLAFLIGFGWQYMRAERLESELSDTRAALAESRLEAGLAIALLEAQQGNYELARQRASDFFTGLQQRVARGDDTPAEFRAVLSNRDPAITMLSRNSPESVALLQDMYAQFRSGLRRTRGE